MRDNDLRMRLLDRVRTTVGYMALRENNGIDNNGNNDDDDDDDDDKTE